MRRRRTAGGSVVALAGIAGLLAALAPGAAADPPPEGTSGTWAWIRSQMGTGTEVTSGSGIALDTDYPADWTGAITGTVTLDDIGSAVPSQDLRVELLVVTDRVYPVAVAEIGPGATFFFAWSSPGVKIIRLLDSRTGAVLAEHAPDTGLVRSFDVPSTHALVGRTYSYDQGLALLTALSLGDLATADRLARGLIALQTDGGAQDGGFITSAAALNPAAGTAEYRTGNHGVATYALLRYLRDGAPGSQARATAVDAAERAVAWLLAQRVTGGELDGLVRGGYGVYVGGVFQPTQPIPWASTEHNVDAWHALRLGAQVLADPGLDAAADALEDAILDRLWSAQENRFWQGRSPEGPDHGHALDVSSWGAIFLQAAGHPGLAQTALANLAWYASQADGASGYAPVPFPATPIVWVEGTAGVALAQLRVGDAGAAAGTMAAVAPLQHDDGAWPGATRDDNWLSMTAAPAVGGAAWMVLTAQAQAGHPSIWDEIDDNEHEGAP